MPTIRQLEEQGRALLEDQKKLVLDTQRPWSSKRAEYDRREADLAAVIEQRNALRSVQGHGLESLGDPAGPTSGPLRGMRAGIAAKGFRPIAAPQIDLSDDDVKELHDAAVSRKSLAVESKATDSTVIGPATITEYRLPPVTARREPTRVLSLLPTFATSAPSVTWFSTTGTTAAAAVAEGGVKPTSTIAYTAQITSATKLAHVAEVTDETLQDFSGFLGVLETDMSAGLVKAENAELLNATVAGASKFAGMLNTTGILTRARTTEPYLDTVLLGFDDLRLGTAFAGPDGIVLNPATWGLLRRQKDGQGRYYLSPDPTADTSPNLWGVPVVLTTQIAAGTVLMGAFADSVVVYVRDGIRLDVSGYGSAQFTNNTTLVRAEERIILTCPRPSGLVRLTNLV
ncbi:MAG: phage major capsid protein [Actinomycetota bacterium]|nr:phage major capsid protein [Actinomycetota bacterium]